MDQAIALLWLTVLVAAGSLVVSVTMALRLQNLELLVRNQRQPSGDFYREETFRPLSGPNTPRPMEALRVALAISQDHKYPVFANTLKEYLLSEDVADVAIVPPTEGKDNDSVWKERVDLDILITGELVCNGYSDIYYRADFTCSSRKGAICTLIEKPPYGDRPGNLVIELVAKLKLEIAKSAQRGERSSAIRELHDV